jgi:cytochrome c6
MKFYTIFHVIVGYFIFFLNLNLGERLFTDNCIACHQNGKNIIIPEKNLTKATLQANGMDNIDSIMYQIINGKNGMPAFGGRLKKTEIKEIANYVFNDPFSLSKSIIN